MNKNGVLVQTKKSGRFTQQEFPIAVQGLILLCDQEYLPSKEKGDSIYASIGTSASDVNKWPAMSMNKEADTHSRAGQQGERLVFVTWKECACVSL
jgi:hypothetical protein